MIPSEAGLFVVLRMRLSIFAIWPTLILSSPGIAPLGIWIFHAAFASYCDKVFSVFDVTERSDTHDDEILVIPEHFSRTAVLPFTDAASMT